MTAQDVATLAFLDRSQVAPLSDREAAARHVVHHVVGWHERELGALVVDALALDSAGDVQAQADAAADELRAEVGGDLGADGEEDPA